MHFTMNYLNQCSTGNTEKHSEGINLDGAQGVGYWSYQVPYSHQGARARDVFPLPRPLGPLKSLSRHHGRLSQHNCKLNPRTTCSTTLVKFIEQILFDCLLFLKRYHSRPEEAGDPLSRALENVVSGIGDPIVSSATQLLRSAVLNHPGKSRTKTHL